MANVPAPDVPASSLNRLHKSKPIVLYLILLALVALVPVLGFSVVLLQVNNHAQEEVVKSLALATTRSIGQSVDREIQGMTTTLKVLSTSPLLAVGDFKSFHNRAKAALAGTGTFILLVDAQLNQLLNTRVPFGTPLQKAADTVSPIQAIKTGQPVISDLLYGKVAKDWVVNVSVPVQINANQNLALVMTRNAQNLSSALVSRQLPEGWQVALIDGGNKVIAGSASADLKPGEAFFVPMIQGKFVGDDWKRQRIKGTDYVTITATSFLSGWRIVAWAPAATVDRALQTSLLWLVFGGILTVLAASVATFYLAREISQSVRGVARDARRLGAGEDVPRRDFPISEIATISDAIGNASLKRQSVENEVRFLMRELAHRSKNQMTVIAAMAKQTARGADSVPEFVQSFEKRILGLARSTDLLLANGIAGVDLRELLSRQIDPFCALDGERVTLTGPSLRLNTQASQILGMAAHELATNAAKYGAFADDNGKLTVIWTVRNDRLEFNWREKVPDPATFTDSDGEPKDKTEETAARRGFGTTVLESMVGASLGAEVTRTLHADGIEWNFDIPFSGLDPNRGAEDEAQAEADAEADRIENTREAPAKG